MPQTFWVSTDNGILLLKSLHEEEFGHELQQMFSFFSIDKYKLKVRHPTENFDLLLTKNKLE